MTELQLSMSEEIVEELEAYRRKHRQYWPNFSPLQKAHVINEIASIFNKYWCDSIRPLLKGRPWGDPMKLFQDIIGDESRKKERTLSQWMMGSLDTKSFIEHIAFIVRRYLKP